MWNQSIRGTAALVPRGATAHSSHPPFMHPRHAGVISSRELAVHNVGLNGYEERGAPIGSRAGRVGVPTGTLTR